MGVKRKLLEKRMNERLRDGLVICKKGGEGEGVLLVETWEKNELCLFLEASLGMGNEGVFAKFELSAFDYGEKQPATGRWRVSREAVNGALREGESALVRLLAGNARLAGEIAGSSESMKKQFEWLELDISTSEAGNSQGRIRPGRI